MKDANPMEENARSGEDPKAILEMMYVDEYLHDKGFSIKEMDTLPAQGAERLMIDAYQYASLKLAELESRARLRTKIKNSSDNWKSP
jgi:hypothetical protein